MTTALPTLPPEPRLTRLVGLDLLRVLGAVAVVYIHVPEVSWLVSAASWGRFAVPAFTTMSIVLLTLNLRRKPLAERGAYVRGRFLRLYGLFLAWNAIYAVARLLKKGFITEVGNQIRLDPGSLLFSGYAEHLWYLSSLAWITLLMAGCVWIFLSLDRVGSLGWALLLAGGAAILCTGIVRIPVDIDAWPSSYFASFSIANVAAGLFAPLVAWLWINLYIYNPRWSLCLPFGVASFVALWLDTAPDTHVLWGSVCGPLFVLAALTLPIRRAPPLLNSAAACALPVYCIHVLFIQGIHAVAPKLHVGSSVALDLSTLFITLVLSFLFGWLLQRSSPDRWFVALHR